MVHCLIARISSHVTFLFTRENIALSYFSKIKRLKNKGNYNNSVLNAFPPFLCSLYCYLHITCSTLFPRPMSLVHHQPVICPGNGEVHGDLQGLLAVYHLAHLPDGEGVVDVHGLPLIIKQEGRLLLVIIFWEAPGQLF